MVEGIHAYPQPGEAFSLLFPFSDERRTMIRWSVCLVLRGSWFSSLISFFPHEFLLLLNESQVHHARTESGSTSPTVNSAGVGWGLRSRIHRPRPTYMGPGCLPHAKSNCKCSHRQILCALYAVLGVYTIPL